MENYHISNVPLCDHHYSKSFTYISNLFHSLQNLQHLLLKVDKFMNGGETVQCFRISVFNPDTLLKLQLALHLWTDH